MRCYTLALLAIAVLSKTNGSIYCLITAYQQWLIITASPTHEKRVIVDWDAAYTKATAALAKLSQTDKIGIVTGTGWQAGNCVGNTKAASSIGYPSLCLQDGPLGVRYILGATAFSAGIHAGTYSPHVPPSLSLFVFSLLQLPEPFTNPT